MQIEFEITEGPYKGEYAIDPQDFTASEYGQFRRSVGLPLGQVNAGNVDIDVVAGLVWLMRRRKTKGLSYEQVADSFTAGQLEVRTDDDDEDGDAAEVVDPEA